MIGRASLRPWLAVVGSVLSFALVLETAGLMPAVMVTVAVACWGSLETTPREALVFGGCLAIAMAVLFVFALGQPLSLIGGW